MNEKPDFWLSLFWRDDQSWTGSKPDLLRTLARKIEQSLSKKVIFLSYIDINKII